MKSARLAFVVTMVVLLGASASQAEAWSFKNLIPSLGKDDGPARGLYSEPDKPSMWQRMNSGTKKLFAKTKSAVPPWLMPETQDRVRRSGSSIRRSTTKIREELRTARRNLMAPWTAPEEPERPQTVTDFLGQPMPE